MVHVSLFWVILYYFVIRRETMMAYNAAISNKSDDLKQSLQLRTIRPVFTHALPRPPLFADCFSIFLAADTYFCFP